MYKILGATCMVLTSAVLAKMIYDNGASFNDIGIFGWLFFVFPLIVAVITLPQKGDGSPTGMFGMEYLGAIGYLIFILFLFAHVYFDIDIIEIFSVAKSS